jgi:hypothetical protein
MGAARAAFSAPTGRLGLGPVTSAGPVRVVCHSSHPRAETPPRRSSKTRAHQGPRTPRPLPRWLGEALLHWSPCFRRRDWRDEIAPIPSPLPSPAFGLRRLPLPPEVIALAVRWYLRFDLPTGTSKSFSLNAGSRSTTSASNGGSSGSPRSSAEAARAVSTWWGIAGTWTRPTLRSEQSGATCSGPSTSSARSSTCTSRHGGTERRRDFGARQALDTYRRSKSSRSANVFWR